MIVVDSSALLAILLAEPRAEDCLKALAGGGALLISAATLTESLIVANRRGLAENMKAFVDDLGLEVVTVGAREARLAADAHANWGKGIHAASLNYGDCFSYALAKERDCPLLFVGDDFARTDIRSAIKPISEGRL